MSIGLMNRSSPSTSLSSIVVCDSIQGLGAGKSTYNFIPAGWEVGTDGIPALKTPNIINNADVGADSYAITSLSVPESVGAVFCGQATRLMISVNSECSILIVGMNANNPIQETIDSTGVLRNQLSTNWYTSISYIQALNGNANGLSVSTTPCVAVFGQPELAASVDVNSQSGVILNPRLTNKEILSLDTVNIIGNGQPKVFKSNLEQAIPSANGLSATTDGMQVYNKTTGCMSTKRNGRWDNLYLEDPLKTEYQYSYTLLNQDQINNLLDSPVPLLSGFTPVKISTRTYYGSIKQGQTIVANMTPNAPAFINLLVKGNNGNYTFTIKGLFNGIEIEEELTVPSNGATLDSTYKYSYIESMILTDAGGIGTLFADLAMEGQSVFVNRCSMQLFASGGTIFNVPEDTNFVFSGRNIFQGVYATSLNDSLSASFLGQNGLNEETNALFSVNATFLPPLNNSVPLISLTLDNEGISGGSNKSRLIVGLEYYIIW